jgi:hypothetical protein
MCFNHLSDNAFLDSNERTSAETAGTPANTGFAATRDQKSLIDW